METSWRVGISIGLVALAAACNSASPAPSSETTAPQGAAACASDADCTLVDTADRDGFCCSTCEPRALPRAEAERHETWCHEHWGPDHAQHCQNLNCPTREHTVACESGTCVVRTGS